MVANESKSRKSIQDISKMMIRRVLKRLWCGGQFIAGPLSVPHFLIIGVQKGGTTSLYEYLQQHPQVQSALIKEVHFFDLNFEKGWDWYQEQLGQNNQSVVTSRKKLVTGEASPYYIFHPLVPERVYHYIPNVKLIILLRDPVARSLSQYHHECRWDFESLGLEMALAAEPERLKFELEKFSQDPHYQSYAYQHYSYVKRGFYLEQILTWQHYFQPSQILIIQSEFLSENPDQVLIKVLDFLGLDQCQFKTQERHNSGQYPPAPERVKQQLAKQFLVPNQKLLGHLEMHWPSENLMGFGAGEVNWLTPV